MVDKKTTAVKTEEKKKKNEKGVPTNTIAVILIVAIIIVAYFVIINPASSEKNINENSKLAELYKKRLNSDGAIALLDSYKKYDKTATDYEIEYMQIDPGGNEVLFKLRKNEESREITMKGFAHESKFYFDDNQTVVCEKYLTENIICSKINEKDKLMETAKKIFKSFPGEYDSKSLIKDDTKKIKYGAISFIAKPEDSKVAGRDCVKIKYNIDYTGLTQDQLAEVGRYGYQNNEIKYNITRCYDKEFGIILSSNELFYIEGQREEPLEYNMKYEKFLEKDEEKITTPEINSNVAEVEAKAKESEDISTKIRECVDRLKGDNNSMDKCILQVATEKGSIALCKYIKSDEWLTNCVVRVAIDKKDATYCSDAGVNRDICYAELAYAYSDKSYCNLIVENKVRDDCKDAVDEKKLNVNTAEIEYMIPENISELMQSEAMQYWETKELPISILQWEVRAEGTKITLANYNDENISIKQMWVANQSKKFADGFEVPSMSVKDIVFESIKNCKDNNSSEEYKYNISFVYDTMKMKNLSFSGAHPIQGYCKKLDKTQQNSTEIEDLIDGVVG